MTVIFLVLQQSNSVRYTSSAEATRRLIFPGRTMEVPFQDAMDKLMGQQGVTGVVASDRDGLCIDGQLCILQS